MRVEKAPVETYADVGGLDDQIMEIKVELGLRFNHLSIIHITSTSHRYLYSSHLGGCGAPSHASRAFRRDWSATSQRSHSLRRAWYRQNSSR